MSYYKEWLKDNEELVLWVDKHLNFEIKLPKIALEDEDEASAWLEAANKIDKAIEEKFKHRFKILSEPNYDCNGIIADCWIGAYLSEEEKNDPLQEPIFAYYINQEGKPEDIVFKVERELEDEDYCHKEHEYYSIEEIKDDLKALHAKQSKSNG